MRPTRLSKGTSASDSLRSSRRSATVKSSGTASATKTNSSQNTRGRNKTPAKSPAVADTRKRKSTSVTPSPARTTRNRSAPGDAENKKKVDIPAKKPKKETEVTPRGKRSARSSDTPVESKSVTPSRQSKRSVSTRITTDKETNKASDKDGDHSDEDAGDPKPKLTKTDKIATDESPSKDSKNDNGKSTGGSRELQTSTKYANKKNQIEDENTESVSGPRRSIHIDDSSDEEQVLETSGSNEDDDDVIFQGEEFSVDSDEEEEEEEEEVEESSSDEELIIQDNLRQTEPKGSWNMANNTQGLYKRIIQLETDMITMRRKQEADLKTKNEQLRRLENDLKWKDEQLEEMRSLADKNMELESRINHIMSDPKNYDEEIKKVKEQEEKEDIEPAEVVAQGEGAPAKTKKGENSHPEENADNEEEREENAEKSGKKTRRKRSSKKKKEENTGPDEIDAYFVDSDDSDVQVTGEESPKPKTLDHITESSSRAKKDKKATGEIDEQEKETEENNDEKDDSPHKGRREIRKMMTATKLQEQTKQAAKAEKDRADRAKKEHDKHLVVTVKDPKTKEPVTKQLVLAFKEGTKKPLVEVNQKLIKKLKPHQVEAVEFMWDNLVESMDKLKEKNPGSGCLLAHCMGLGKTLSVITLIHTLLTTKGIGMKKCLVVCPLNTVLNWQYEWEKWLDKKDRLKVYELASAKTNHSRADMLMTWKKGGGIMIMGYQLFRILVRYSGRSKRVKKSIQESLVDPGPDVVVCDEGHILKNDASAVSKSMNSIKTKRRIVLTGTPLQNNLIEYHCMVNFVKPNLLGSRREFGNRFVNPITNGQHSDSTSRDVKVMKRRAHILHSMLDGCVQRRDYSALVKFLPPKNEYVISVRLSKIQIELYEKYLELNRPEIKLHALNGGGSGLKIKGAGLFSDYQNLMRIWTHPWVLKLDEIRQEKKPYTEDDDDELESIIFTSSDEEEEDTLSESSQQTATSEEEPMDLTSDTETDKNAEPEEPRARRTRSLGRSEEKPQEGRRGLRTRSNEGKENKTDLNKKSDKDDAEDSNRSRKDKKSKDKSTGKQKIDKKRDSDTVKVKSRKGKKGTSTEKSDDTATETDTNNDPLARKAKLVAGEVIKQWQSSSRNDGRGEDELSRKRPDPWWHTQVKEEHKTMLELSGKIILMFEILRMAETFGDKVLVFSQSLLSLDLIEDFLAMKNEEAEKKPKSKINRWAKDEDYCRMDGSTGAQSRNKLTGNFNNLKNKRMRLFLISTKAGGLGINLDSANRVIIFDASWNPSHDIQSIFRVYRFGQEKDVYIYRFLAQGTMEEKIYERQVTKETLSQRVIDEHQIDRHFSASDLAELYNFKPDRLDDPDNPPRPTPAVPKDVVLAELLTTQKDWIVQYHEHDSLLENRPEEDLSEEERKAAWEDYEREKKGISSFYRAPFPGGLFGTYQGATLGTNIPLLPSFRLPTYAPPRGPGSMAPGVNLQIAQLPRVVQEILKYNPTISSDDLSKRLQAFLGMHSRYSSVPGHAMGPQGPQTMNVSLPGLQLPQLQNLVSSLPAVVGTGAPLANTATWNPANTVPQVPLSTAASSAAATFLMPSRLPQPGYVPANKK